MTVRRSTEAGGTPGWRRLNTAVALVVPTFAVSAAVSSVFHVLWSENAGPSSRMARGLPGAAQVFTWARIWLHAELSDGCKWCAAPMGVPADHVPPAGSCELTGTTPSACVVCADFPWPGWGLTTTVPYDQITLLKQLIEPGPLLTAADRQYALSLLENVTPDQAWGVSGGVPAGVTVALKNGWLPLNDDNTDWQINSEGWVSGDGRDYLISVLTTGNPTEQYGIDTINGLSSLIWTALR